MRGATMHRMGEVREMLPKAQGALVAQLEAMLDLVESGQVVGLGYVMIRKDEDPLQGYVGEDANCNVNQLVSALNVLMFRVLHHQYGDEPL
jgi:hypothetical protein